MTLHKAKGLEFDWVIIPSLQKITRTDTRPLLLWDDHSSVAGERGFLLAADDHSEAGAPTLYNYLQQQRQAKNLLEGTRLLYVGATRAISQLLLTASLNWDDRKQAFSAPSARALLSPIWPTFEQQMIVHTPALAAADAVSPRQAILLSRLQSDSAPPVYIPVSDTAVEADSNIPLRPFNYMERSVGTVVHLALEELSLRSVLPSAVAKRDRDRWRQALQCHGLWGAPLEEALESVVSSVMQSLGETGAGRWVLSAAHSEARSEWPLTCADGQGGIVDIIIDRTFIDPDSDERWLIDYKNSRPLPAEKLEAFLLLLRVSGSALGGFLVFAALVIVANTIKLTLYARQDELEAMAMVGGTSLFIKLPYLVEGAIQGILGGVAALGLSFLVFQVILQKSLGSLLLITGIDTIHFLPPIWQGMLVVGGGLIGLLGSLFALRKFVRFGSS